MHGLLNRAIEDFTRTTYGDAIWAAAATASGVDPRGFALMHDYADRLTGQLMREIAQRLARSPRELAEDIGAWAARVPSLRRLLRFAAPNFHGFILALPELNDRALMVVRGIRLPLITVRQSDGGWTLSVDGERIWLHVLSGILHAMADDYGVLAVIDIQGDEMHVSVPLTDFSSGRPFSISDPSIGA